MKNLAQLHKDQKLVIFRDGKTSYLAELVEEGELNSSIRSLHSEEVKEVHSKCLSKTHCFTKHSESESACENCAIKDACKSTQTRLNKDEPTKSTITEQTTMQVENAQTPPAQEQPQTTEAAAPVETPVQEQAAPVETPVQEQAAPVETPAQEQAAPVETPVQEQAAPVETPVQEQAASKRTADTSELKEEKILKDSEGNEIRLARYKSGSYEVFKNGEKISAKPFFQAFLQSKQIEIKAGAQTRAMGRMVFKALG